MYAHCDDGTVTTHSWHELEQAEVQREAVVLVYNRIKPVLNDLDYGMQNTPYQHEGESVIASSQESPQMAASAVAGEPASHGAG